MKKAVLFIFILLVSINVFAQTKVPVGFDLSNYGVRVEPDKRLMAVLATLEVAEVNTPLTEQGTAFRNKLKADLQGSSEEFQTFRVKVKTFIERHKKAFASRYKENYPKATDAEIEAEMISPFISMAYTLSPAPELADPVITSDLPGNLLDVLDFAPLVREFYRRSSFSANINNYIKEYQITADAKLRNSARQMVADLSDYLHTRPQVFYTERIKTETQKGKSKKTTLQQIERRERERRFFIVPELLAPKGNINFLNISDDYFAVVSPETDLSLSEVRRGYLQFIFDPLVLSNAKDITTFKPMIKVLLDERRKTNPNVSPDVFLAVSRSLVAAADARQIEFEKVRIATSQARANIQLMKTEDEKKAVSAELEKFKQTAADQTALQLSEDYERGAVLAFYFADQLKGLEDSGFDVASSMRDMILSLETAKENNRLEQFAEARQRAVANRSAIVTNTTVIENPITKKLLDIDEKIKAKNYPQAKIELTALASTNPNEARVYYSLGRVASLSAETIEDIEARKKKLVEAQEAYSKAVNIELKKPVRDVALLSLSYVALARIYEFYDQTEYAMKIYDVAIQIGNVQNGAFNEAVAAKQRLMKEQ